VSIATNGTSRRKPAKRAVAPPDAKGGGPARERELRAQGKKTMRKLLDAGMTVFERRGYHAARVDDIVKVAKTSHGTFYLYFSNKEDLFRALAVDVAEQMSELAEELGSVTPDDDGYEELRSWLDRFTELYFAYGPVIRAWTEAELVENDLGRLGGDVLQTLARNVAERIAESNPGVDPAVAALAFFSMVERSAYLVLSRQISVERDQLVDTLAAVAHAGMFAGQRGTKRLVRRA
jgi:AcrR family transcriptional regulator